MYKLKKRMQSRERVGDNSKKNSRSSNYSGPDETGTAGRPGEQRNNGSNDSHSMPGLSLIRPSSRSLILKIQLNSRNEFQQLLLGPGAPLWAWPSCNVLGNVISAIGVLIVSIFYQEEGLGTFGKCQNICTLSTWSTLVSLEFLLFLHRSHFSFQTISQRASQTPGSLKYVQLGK